MVACRSLWNTIVAYGGLQEPMEYYSSLQWPAGAYGTLQ